jgi:spoIIIJ-associated protein
MKEIEVKGKDIDDAVNKGLKNLGLTREQVEIKILDEGKSGLFGLMGSSPAIVKLIIKDGVTIPDKDYKSISERISKKVSKILELMELDLKLKTTYIGGRILLNIEGADTSIIIGRSGFTLDALEDIVNLIAAKDEKCRLKIVIDAEMYKARHEERIRDIAKRVADEVRTTGRKRELKPMTSNERRIVHLTLENDKDVESISVGYGRDRRVIIVPRESKEKNSFGSF